MKRQQEAINFCVTIPVCANVTVSRDGGGGGLRKGRQLYLPFLQQHQKHPSFKLPFCSKTEG